jgi:hypothetical protein
MKLLEDPIEIQAYTELMISCSIDGCVEDFQESLTNPAKEPVEAWAKIMAARARESGWASDGSGRILCPLHAQHIRS